MTSLYWHDMTWHYMKWQDITILIWHHHYNDMTSWLCDNSLSRVDISSCNNMTDNSLRALGRGCSQVMSNVKCTSWSICAQLVSVNLSWCEMMTAAGVAALAEGCPLLNTFIAKVNTFSPESPLLMVNAGLCPHWWRGPLPAGQAVLSTAACQSPRMSQCPGWRGHGARGE